MPDNSPNNSPVKTPLKTLVVGIGSYYGDDTAGLEIIELLQQHFKDKTDIDFYTSNAPQEILILMNQFKCEQLKALVIIDVLESDNGLCDITQLKPDDLQLSVERTSDHYASLYEVLKIIQILYFPDININIFGLPLKQDSEYLHQSACHLQKLISTV
jgi:hydrogenase maturation protease